MRYYELLKALEESAREEPIIKTVVWSDVYKLNMYQVEYSAFCAALEKVEESEEERSYYMVLYYADRLCSENNCEEIQSAAIDVLDSIVDRLGLDVSEKEWGVFTNSFKDELAGASLRVRIKTTLC